MMQARERAAEEQRQRERELERAHILQEMEKEKEALRRHLEGLHVRRVLCIEGEGETEEGEGEVEGDWRERPYLAARLPGVV